MAAEKEYLTKEKLDELTRELDFLKTGRRKEIAEKLEFAKSLGDLSENAEYQEAREDQAATEERILKLQNILSGAIIITKKKGDDVLRIGSTVIVEREGEKQSRQYQIVGSEEADMAGGKISNKSPIGEALLGKAKGETVVFDTPGGKTT
ncbi:MAG: Transcription elongation factor GreA, partial [Microgenomates group bacterium GW2011_GWC1_38_14]